MTTDVKEDVIDSIVGGDLPDETISAKIKDVHVSDLRTIISLIDIYIAKSEATNDWISNNLIANLNSVNTKL